MHIAFRPQGALRSTRLTGVCLALGVVSLLALATATRPGFAVGSPSASPAGGPQNYRPSPGNLVAKVGDERITEKDVMARDQAEFDRLQEDQGLKLRQLQLTQAQERYALLKQQAEKLLDARALALEAKQTGKADQVLLADVKVTAVTEAESRAFYEANKARTQQTFEQLQPEITQYLANQHNTEATRGFYDELRTKHQVASLLEPYRLAVEPVGPARGKDKARVTVVEFADFQCPYCRQAQDTLKIVMGMHPDDIRVVFRQLPLASIHPNALIAARAAVCADHQGMFWPMHDAMYSDQDALGEAGLKNTAKRIGLDAETFSICLKDDATAKSIFADVKAADELNVGSTPFFFINGRPVKGSVPVDQFEMIVAEELRRTASNRG